MTFPAQGSGLLAPLALAFLPAQGGVDGLISRITVSTVLLAGGIAAIWWGRRWLLKRVNRIALSGTQRIASVRVRRAGLQGIMQVARMLVRLGSVALVLGGFLLWLTFIGRLFPDTEAWSGRLEHAILAELREVGTLALQALPGLGVIVVLFFITRVLHEFLSHYFLSIEHGEVESEYLDAVTAETTRRLAGAALWISAIIIAFPYIPGSETPVFRGISILAGLMVSLGSTNLVGQMINGLVLIYSKTLRPGDCVSIGDVEGVVERISLFSCAVRTPNEELVTLPNATVAAGVKNFSRAREGSAVRFVTTVTIGYDAPWQTVHDLLRQAAAEAEGVLREPVPLVRQAALDDFYVRYDLVFAPADPRKRRQVLSRVHEAIQERFHAAGLQIMSPHYENDPPSPKIPQRRVPAG